MVLHLVVYELAVVGTTFRIELMETLHDALGMTMVVGKDNGLANVLAAMHLQSVGHQFGEHVVDGVVVDEIVEYLATLYVAVVVLVLRNAVERLLILPHLLQFLALCRGEFVVLYAAVYHLRRTVLHLVWHKILIGNSLLEAILKVRLVVEFEQSERVAVNLVARSGSKTNKQRVEILEYGVILTEHATMCLIDNDKVEVSYRELHGHGIYIVYHRLIGREDEACVKIGHGILRQTSYRLAGQEILIVLARLVNEFGSVGKEQHLLYPIVVRQKLAKRDTHTCLARTGSQHEQSASMLLVEPFHQTLYGCLLIWSVGYGVVDGEIGYVGTSTLLYQVFQIVVTVE